MRVALASLLLTSSLFAQAIGGLDVGQKIPAFSLSDQNGKIQTFGSIKGPKGAMLVFFNSADW